MLPPVTTVVASASGDSGGGNGPSVEEWTVTRHRLVAANERNGDDGGGGETKKGSVDRAKRVARCTGAAQDLRTSCRVTRANILGVCLMSCVAWSAGVGFFFEAGKRGKI
jgi:hypothetical protein